MFFPSGSTDHSVASSAVHAPVTGSMPMRYSYIGLSWMLFGGPCRMGLLYSSLTGDMPKITRSILASTAGIAGAAVGCTMGADDAPSRTGAAGMASAGSAVATGAAGAAGASGAAAASSSPATACGGKHGDTQGEAEETEGVLLK